MLGGKRTEIVLLLFFVVTFNIVLFFNLSNPTRKTAPVVIRDDWLTTYDFLHKQSTARITGKANNVGKTEFSINDQPRDVLYQHPNSEVIFNDVPIYKNAKLEFGIGIDQTVWEKEGDGVMFEISIVGENPQNILLFSRYLDPKNNVLDRKWFDEQVKLSDLADKKVTFIFKTTAGPEGNAAYDRAGWSNPLLRKKPEVTLIDLGTPEARQYMQDGWSVDEKIPDGTTLVWGMRNKSTLDFSIPEAREIKMIFRCMPFQFAGSPVQIISILVNGKEIEPVRLKPGPLARYQIYLPRASVVPKKNRIEFRYAYARSPVDVMPETADARLLAVLWDYIYLIEVE